jgi:hypothetical protein
MEVDQLEYPVLIWNSDTAFLARTAKNLRMADKSLLPELRQKAAAGKTFLVSSDGYYFKVVDFRRSDKQPLFGIRADPVLEDAKKVELDEFKKLVGRAIKARQRGDYDSDLVGQLRACLPQAGNYRDVLACVPKGM